MDTIHDLYTLTLVDGIKAVVDSREIRYRKVKLRDTDVGDERAAQRMAERVVHINGVPTLLTSDADFRFALTMRHIESFECDGQVIPRGLIDLSLMEKLSSHDMGLIEQRVFLTTLSAEVRYGNLTQAQFDEIVAPKGPAKPAPAPQPEGQAAAAGQDAPDAESGPAMLADFARGAAGGAPSGDAR